MSRGIRVLAILSASCLTTACATYAVRSPECVPPPLPEKVLQPCPEPELPAEGTFSALYLNSLRNTGPWGQCMRLHDQMVTVYRYQQQVVAQCVDTLNRSRSESKPWWKFGSD